MPDGTRCGCPCGCPWISDGTRVAADTNPVFEDDDLCYCVENYCSCTN